jgi:hypothetical protein
VGGIKSNLKTQVVDRLPCFKTPEYLYKLNVDKFIKATGGMEGWTQRAVLGGAAIMTQPLIDLNNQSVDKETRKYSAVKTAVKIVIGTSMGVATRYLFGTALAKCPKFIGTASSFIKTPANVNAADFTKGVSMFVGCIGTVISTFLIDKPLTNPAINAALKFFNVSEKPKTGAKK